jgi:hypothetical protein
MKKIYENLEFTRVGYFESILNEAGIETLVKNAGSAGLMGEVPMFQVYPELWVVDDADYDEALAILEPYYRAMKESPKEWKCECGETLDGSFGECWKCGASAPQAATADD